jgi:hypothetical protein
MIRRTIFFTVTIFMLSSCSLYQTVTNISRLKFKLDSVSDFQVLSIKVSDKTQLKDFNPLDILKLTSEFAQGRLPVSFSLNVGAKNPNDGTGGYAASDLTLKSFPWRLFIDGKETIAGNIGSPIVVPGVGQTKMIPLEIKLDLLQFFSGENFDSIINLALKLGGGSGSASQIKLVAKPVLGTVIGDLQYPNELTIVDFQFN